MCAFSITTSLLYGHPRYEQDVYKKSLKKKVLSKDDEKKEDEDEKKEEEDEKKEEEDAENEEDENKDDEKEDNSMDSEDGPKYCVGDIFLSRDIYQGDVILILFYLHRYIVCLNSYQLILP